MKKQKKQLILLLVLLVLAIGAWLGIRISNNKKEEAKAAEEEAAKVYVCQIASEDVSALTFTVDGEETTFTRDGEDWVCESDSSLNIDADVIETKLSKFEALEATEKIDATEDLAEYGLDDPDLTVMLDVNGSTETFAEGAYNSMVSGYYILYKDEVYLVNSYIHAAFGDVSMEDLLVEEEETESTEAEETVSATEAE